MKGIVCNLRIQLRDEKTGAVISDLERKSHSFVRNFMQMLYYGSLATANAAYRDTSDVARPACVTTRGCAGISCVGSAGITTAGIVVGGSNLEFDISQYNIQSLISHGTGTGQFSYAAMNNPDEPSFIDPDIFLILSRDMANNSGSSIIVREIGLIGYPVYDGWYSHYASVLYARDVVDDTVVANGQVLNVQYLFKTVVE
jgi:hypothetical protein